MNKNKTVITFGTFDLFHLGHLRILERAHKLGNKLVVGVSSDALNFDKKNVKPVYPQDHRCEIVSSIRYVDTVFVEESLELKSEYIQQHKADVLVMGSDWEGQFDSMNQYCEVVYLPRTDIISTTYFKSYIAENL